MFHHPVSLSSSSLLFLACYVLFLMAILVLDRSFILNVLIFHHEPSCTQEGAAMVLCFHLLLLLVRLVVPIGALFSHVIILINYSVLICLKDVTFAATIVWLSRRYISYLVMKS